MPSDRQVWNAVEKILASNTQLACSITGGGSTLINWLFNHPGASRVLVEAQVPYSSRALEKFLCKPGPHPVVANTARDMAFVAYARAIDLVDNKQTAVGFGLTAALTTTRARRGSDRAFVASVRDNICRIGSASLSAKKIDRSEQEVILTSFGLSHLAAIYDVEFDPDLPDWVELGFEMIDLNDPLRALFEGKIDILEMGIDGRFSTNIRGYPRVFLSGSFNPLHQGHINLAKTVEKLSGREVNLELSIQNVDKPDISLADIEKRLAGICGHFPVILTRCSRFFDKARFFVAPHFVVGYDTAARMVDGKYYQNGKIGMESSLQELKDSETIIWVAGRLVDGRFKTFKDLSLPDGLDGLFRPVTQEQFRLDVSSTQLRSKKMIK
tara:strand:+ start:642 stop:1790 length:1149 start_codon:yes stop_codon:yes gene_type:complete